MLLRKKAPPMPLVYIPTPLRRLTGGASEAQVEGATLRQVIASLDAAHPGVAAVLTRDDALAPGPAVSIDGAFSNRELLANVGPASEIRFSPAIGGGRGGATFHCEGATIGRNYSAVPRRGTITT